MQPKKNDDGKIPLDLLPFDAVEAVGAVERFGAEKYGRRNWESNGGMSYGRLIAAALRHIFAFSMGKDTDEESKLPHLAHAACNILFLLAYQLRNIGEDDRGQYDPE